MPKTQLLDVTKPQNEVRIQTLKTNWANATSSPAILGLCRSYFLSGDSLNLVLKPFYWILQVSPIHWMNYEIIIKKKRRNKILIVI